MANEKRLIDVQDCPCDGCKAKPCGHPARCVKFAVWLNKTVDAVEVVRCQNCVHAEPLDRNCELSTTHYLHCKLWRGEETKNVWHKYKKYYKDYSLVERDGYCDAGAKMDGGNEDG